ncbi:protein wings apart-like [Anthonomus grandis grandis]|uniref:protein wings apart-like n=1 Tax=Anthonomus grandis grandis TaxID=2921223 RepID=UPI0021655133|nr:protein wings apart-like [Anthonomus grandis grandis]
MSRGFGKHRKGASHHSFHFDTLFKENSNRPSAARSAASVGKWGITSFTSIRTLNGSRQENDSKTDTTPKPKKFFKSRDSSQDVNSTPPSYQATASYGSPAKRARSSSTYEPSDRQTRGTSSTKKFFSSKNSQEKVVLTLNTTSKRRNSDRSDTSEPSKPPIVLRICKGKSQLVSDTEESERTATPASNTSSKSSSTSPRALRESSSNSQPPQTTPPRPSNCRITRSARRSMQMDPSSSPATADTPAEFTLTPSSKRESFDSDLSPQYVPAEKFEEERRALYASLLQPDPPAQDLDSKEEEEERTVILEPEVETNKETAPVGEVPPPQEDPFIKEPESNVVEEEKDAKQDIPELIVAQQDAEEEEEEADMDIDQMLTDPSPAQTPQDPIEEQLAKMEEEETPDSPSEETIENIAKEIEITKAKRPTKQPVVKVGAPVRELRRRGRPREVKEDKEEKVEPEKEEEPPRKLRGGLRTRHKVVKEVMEEDEVDEGVKVDEFEKKPRLKEKPLKAKEPAIVVPTIKIKELPKPDVVKEIEAIPKVEEDKKRIEDDWCTDSDSNSTNGTAPDLEVKQVEAEPEILDNNIEKHKEKILDKILEKPPDPPPVKLVISKKKGSIFKSRAVDDSAKKRRARYVHKWIDDGKGGGETPARPPIENAELDDAFGFKGDTISRVTSCQDEEVTSVTCPKTDKSFYMVVRNVKKAHQIQEIGEFQEFNDDVEYILDALQDNNPVSTRCLSAITLASKCMVPAFRMHVRAHGIVAKFFKALHDACRDQSLGLCTATVMFVLSQDRLNMDLDRDCLELMLNLLESDVSYQQALDVCGLTSAQLEKNKQKVRELCTEIQSQGHAMHLNVENITTGQLAMETLLSLTSKRAGEWFKEELRELGGLEHIMKTIHECCRQVSDYVASWTDALLDKLKKVDRCLRVLENVTQNNEENQTYILKYNEGMMIDTLVNLYKLCDREIPLYPVTDIAEKSSTGTIIREALLVTLKVLINLTHHFRQQSIGSQLVGSRTGIIETSLHLLLQVPNYIPEQKKFELGVLVLMLLINLIQDQEGNKKLLMEAKAPPKLESIYSREESAVEALIVQFYEWEGCAKIAENKTNAILDGEKDEQDQATPAQQQAKTNEEFIEETVAKLLQKAGTHMEYTFLASYIVMLIGFLIMDNQAYQECIRQFLRGGNFTDMVELLKKFFNFMNLTASTEASSVCAVKATQKVIKFLESCDQTDGSESCDDRKHVEPVDMVIPFL